MQFAVEVEAKPTKSKSKPGLVGRDGEQSSVESGVVV